MPSQATYDQRTGRFIIYGDVDGHEGQERIVWEAQGYAGRGECQHNPDCDHKRSQAPLPVGRYGVRLVRHVRFRDPVFRLEQLEGPTYGRSGFLIHGDSANSPGKASQGCIVLRWSDRSAISAYDVRELEVFASLAPSGRVLDSTEGTTGTND